jgi:hypothetical protein
VCNVLKALCYNMLAAVMLVMQGKVVNFVGVQAAVRQAPPEELKEKLRKIPLPEELMRGSDEDFDD